MNITKYHSRAYIGLLPSITYSRQKSTSYHLDRKDLEDGWTATRKQAGSEVENDVIRLSFAWFGFTLIFSWDMTK